MSANGLGQPAAVTDPGTPRLWHFSGIEFKDGDGCLRIGDRDVPVQPLPLKLLRVLLAAAPRVVPRDALIVSVWHRAPQLVSRNVLSNAIGRLREVLGAAAEAHLAAVPGVGYGWRGPVESLPSLPSLSTVPAAETVSAAVSAPAETPQAEADRFMTHLWLDVLRGRRAGHAQMTLHEAVHAGIVQAEAELVGSPAVLACIHRTLASHRMLACDGAGAIRHFRRAWTLVAAPAGARQPELALELHFELCTALASTVRWDGGAVGLRASRRELALARAELRASPGVGAAVRLGAARAALMLAFYEHDWAQALTAAAEVVRETDKLPGADPRRLWECRIHHAAILLRAGEETQAIDAIEALFRQPPPPLDPGDFMLLQARMVRGALYSCIGRHAEAVTLLEPLHAELSGAGPADTGVGPEAATWLAASLLHVGRGTEALTMVQAVHTRAVAQVGESSEAALQPLATLASALAAAGRADEALQLLEQGVGPLLPSLVMPGQRYAVLALARWIDLLREHGDAARALVLSRHLRPRDLRAAALRPADADAFFERGRRALAARRPASSHGRAVRAGRP